jgi:hypothetical protein
MAGKLTKWSQKIPTSSIERPSKIYPNWDFWFENVHTTWQPWSVPGRSNKNGAFAVKIVIVALFTG